MDVGVAAVRNYRFRSTRTTRDRRGGNKSFDEIIEFIAGRHGAGIRGRVPSFASGAAAPGRVVGTFQRGQPHRAEEQSELEDFLQLEHIVIMAKARVRQHTHHAK